MLTLCYFYCLDLGWFIFYIAGPFAIVFSLFVLKRGVYHHRKTLRQVAFYMMFAAVLKMFLVDVRMLAGGIKAKLCHKGHFPGFDCTPPYNDIANSHEKMILSFIGFVLLVLCCIILYQLYLMFLPDRKVKEITPEQNHFRAWVNGTLWGVIIMGVWTAAPWLASLLSESGTPPHIFKVVDWQTIAMFNLGLLLIDFWKMESCIWESKITDSAKDKAKRRHLQNTWTPRDTLWMIVFLYVLTLGLAYITWDVLRPKNPNAEVKAGPGFIENLMPQVNTSNPNLTQ